MAQDVFDTPIPGQSLTDEPGNYPWEHAAQYSKPEDATFVIWEKLHEEQTLESVITLLQSGLTVENITRVIIFGGFLEGKYSVDTAILLSPIVARMVATIGQKAGVEKLNLTNGKVDNTRELLKIIQNSERADIDEKEVMKIKEETKKGLMAPPKKEEDEE
jgi:hypothetical protein